MRLGDVRAGMRVAYVGAHGAREFGEVTEVRGWFVGVRFADQPADAPGKSCRPMDLEPAPAAFSWADFCAFWRWLGGRADRDARVAEARRRREYVPPLDLSTVKEACTAPFRGLCRANAIVWLPALVAEVERLRAELAALRAGTSER